MRWNFEYDDADNLIKKGSNAYSYDSLDRLTHAYLLDGFEVRDIDRGIEEVATATQDYRGEAPLILAESDISLKLDTASASIGVILTTIPVEVTRIFLHPGNPNHRIQERHLEIYYKADEVSDFQKITSWNYHRGPEGTIELRLEAPVSATEIKVHCHFNELDPNGDPIDAATFANSPENIITIHYLMPHREETYSYDKVGNRLAQSITQKGTETRNSQYGENKVLLMHNGKTGYVYDILGNLIEKGSDYTYNEVTQTSTVQPSTQDYRRYHYDLFGRMKEIWGVDPETQSLVLLAEYVYDFRGMRIAKIKDGHITRYHLDEEGRNLETETTDESVTTAWIGQKPLGYTDNEGTYWYISDHQGTTFMLTDGEGTILWEDAVNPFGITAGSRGSQDSQVLYTGKIFDADADLYYFNARWYDPETGRFASEDPARDGVNWYAYVGNNPLKYTDPMGLWRTREEREENRARRVRKRESNKNKRQNDRRNRQRVRENKKSNQADHLRSEGKEKRAKRIDDRISDRTARRDMQQEEKNNEHKEREKIWNAIDEIKTTDWAKTEKGSEIVRELSRLHRKGRVDIDSSYTESRAIHLPWVHKGNKNAGIGFGFGARIIVGEKGMSAEALPGRLVHEATHQEQNTLFPKYFDGEREAFDNAYEVERQLGYGLFDNPTNAELEHRYRDKGYIWKP